MATGPQAPATTAEGLTQHTQNLIGRFTAPQLRLLHRPLDPKRVGRDDKGHAHMEAWDIKRYLLRVFGFGGYDTENRELVLVREIEIPSQQQGGKSRWTVVYRAQVRLTVKDVNGQPIAHWDGEAAGGASNQPKLDDAHDMAMKTAASQALKRAAINLGDAFGLSLYNNGSPAAVVNFSAAHPPADWEKTAEPLPEPEDPPVKPEQQAPAAASDDAPPPSQPSAPAAGPGPAPAPPQAASAPAEQPASDPDADELLNKLMLQAVQNRGHRDVLRQVRGNAEKKDVINRQVQGPPPERRWMPFHELLDILDAEAAALGKAA